MENYLREGIIFPECTMGVVKILSKLEKHSLETYNHSLDVGNIAYAIGQRLGLDYNDLSKVYVAGIVHDAGKLEVPAQLLHKKDCSEEERQEIQVKHIFATRKVLLGDFPEDIIRMAYHHHERVNGLGYPSGLVGEELKLTDKILEVADVTSALLMERSYKPEYSIEKAITILEKLKTEGSLDANVVDASIGMLKDKLNDHNMEQ